MAPVRTNLRRTGQRGAFIIALVLSLVVIATVVAATLMLDLAANRAKRTGTSQLNQLAGIQQAIASYVSIHKRLPCPADGSFNVGSGIERGIEIRDGSGYCDSGITEIQLQQTGIVPWRTLGLKEDEVLSADLTYYSYRVFSGPMGLTVDNGADMSNCDLTNSPLPDDATLLTHGQCNTSHGNSVAQFLQGGTSNPNPPKGLSVTRDSVTEPKVAYVLIHHGANGKGAYLSSGSRVLPLPVTGSKELDNTAGVDAVTFKATYYANTPNFEVDPATVDYFDDRLVYTRIDELAKQAGLAAREWPESPLTASTTADMTSDSTDAANPHFMSTGSSSSGTSFQAATVGEVTTVTFGSGSGSYSGCLWWPNSINLNLASTKYQWNIYTEFALADRLNDEAAGFTFGFLSASEGRPNNSTCGDTYTGRLGWADGSLSTYDGKRFAIEVDTRTNTDSPYDADDPDHVHVAVDRNGTRHNGTSAASCASSGFGKSCDRANNDFFLSADGISTFHSLRIEVAKGCTISTTGTGTNGATSVTVANATDLGTGMQVSGDGIAKGATVTGVAGSLVSLSAGNTADIPAGTELVFKSDERIRVKAWVLSNAGCTVHTDWCGKLKNLSAPFTEDMNGSAEALHVSQCLPATSPTSVLDELYFGFTTANYQDEWLGGGTNFSLRNLLMARQPAQ